jgi:drug/metabolite transporter (DMT)-like permease
MLNGAMPIFAALLSTALLRRMPRPARLGGLLTGSVGVTAIAWSTAAPGASSAAGVALILCATLCYGVAVNLAVPLQQRYGAVPVMARVTAFGALWTAPYGLYGLGGSAFAWPALFAVLAVGVIGTGIAYWIMGTLVGRAGSVRASFITYLIPVVALALGVVIRDDQVGGLAVFGVILATIGAMLAARRER